MAGAAVEDGAGMAVVVAGPPPPAAVVDGAAVVAAVVVDEDDVDRPVALSSPSPAQATSAVNESPQARSDGARRREGCVMGQPWWQGPALLLWPSVVSRLVPSCVWRITPELVVRLDERFGEPLDAYVNGSQVWLRDDGPGGITLEWRLHPVPGFRRPQGAATYDLFASVALAIALGEAPVAPPEALWEGLEAFPAHRDETEPPLLRAAVVDALGLSPDGDGLVDHEEIARDWEKTSGRISIVDALMRQLAT